MPNIASVKKRVRQSEKRRMQNKHLRSRMRTLVKTAQTTIASGDKEAAQKAFQVAVSVIDSTADKGIVHKNKAARDKSRLNAKLKALALANAG
ncbi:MAG: 30S ribosomal protein S20 [Thiofilum sp.]|uniref:30S ribosomal protein S20 n=1 Tax=Thiofilum sp. TaxID=2212733 RepID=UPI0025E16B04|nr:30S ribosomal protein S20 [Thiofilum sp.]MBK8452030.1 30S ribosomal protein S20 [Thiofilum sp.]